MVEFEKNENPEKMMNILLEELDSTGLSSICESVKEFEKLTSDKNLKAGNKDLVSLIERDSAVSFEVLRIANSPLYGASKVNRIDLAVFKLGWDAIRSIGLNVSVKGLINNIKNATPARTIFNKNIASAYLGDFFLEFFKNYYDDLNEVQSLYAPIFLQDIGTLGLLQSLEDYSSQTNAGERIARRISLPEQEIEKFGFTHNQFGTRLLYRHNISLHLFTLLSENHHLNPVEYKYKSQLDKRIIAISKFSNASYLSQKGLDIFAEHDFYGINDNDEGVDGVFRTKFNPVFQEEFERELGLTEERHMEIITKLQDQKISGKIKEQQF